MRTAASSDVGEPLGGVDHRLAARRRGGDEVGAEVLDVARDVHEHHYDIKMMSCQHHHDVDDVTAVRVRWPARRPWYRVASREGV